MVLDTWLGAAIGALARYRLVQLDPKIQSGKNQLQAVARKQGALAQKNLETLIRERLEPERDNLGHHNSRAYCFHDQRVRDARQDLKDMRAAWQDAVQTKAKPYGALVRRRIMWRKIYQAAASLGR